MKKILCCGLLLALLLSLALPVFAVTQADSVTSNSTFQTDGSCLISLSMTLQLSGDEEDILIPLPQQTKNLTVDTSLKYKKTSEGLLLEADGSGSRKISLQYTLENLLAQSKQGTFVTLPILGGLHYPISKLNFSVTFPKVLTSQPVLESGYYQQNVEEILEYSFDGKTLSGKSKAALKDRETLSMTIEVPKGYFSRNSRGFALPDVWDLVIILLVALSIVYFLLTLMPKFPVTPRRFAAPDGIHAGDVGTCLTGCGTDLTMLVLSWAQMGYIFIEMDHKNRVTLHKRMEMGNERDSHEVRWFKSLFGQRPMIDGDSYHYAKLCRKLATKSPLRSQLYDKKSGNPVIFRGMCCIVGIVAGLQMGLDMGNSAGTKTLLGMLFACLCGAFSYFIQSGGKCLPLREKTPLWTACGCGAVWIGLGAVAGDLQQALPMVVFQLVAGVAAAYGGKRSEMGLRCLKEIRGLRRHMVSTGTFDMQQLAHQNPYYFYELAPFALVLGVDRQFARRFGKVLLPEDSFLQCGAVRGMTASQFAARLRTVADVLNERQKKLPYEQFKGK